MPRLRAPGLAVQWYPWMILAVSMIAYSNTLTFELVWDDVTAIRQNPLVVSLDVPGIFSTAYWYPSPKLTDLYRPITVLSFAFNHAVGGFAPFNYHLTNVLLHSLNSLFVFLLLQRLTGAPPLASASALIFALHPIHTEAVAWVSGRGELLACFFMLSAWWLSLAGEKQKLPWWKTAAAALLYLLALLSKESALALLPVVWCFRGVRTGLTSSLQDSRLSRWRKIFHPVDFAFLCSAVALILLRVAMLGQAGPKTADTVPFVENPLAFSSFLTRALTSVKLLGLYFWKMCWPVRLSADYSFNQIPAATWADPIFWISSMLFAALAALAVKQRLSSWILGGLMAACAGLGMVIQLLFPTGTLFAERLTYFPLLGFSLALSATVNHPRVLQLLRVKGSVLLAAILLAFFLRTVIRNPDWKDGDTLFRVTAGTAPESAKAQTLAGLALAERNPEAARAYFEKSLQIYPRYLQGRLGLAQAEINSKNFVKAEQILQEVLREDPESLEALQALLVAYRGRGRFDRTLEASDRILARQPKDTFALAERAMALDGLKRSAEAVTAYHAAVAAGADSAEIRNRLGAIYLQAKNLQAALEHFLVAAQLEPSDPVTYFNLADVHRQRGDKQRERQAYLSFLRYWKGDPRIAATIRRRLEELR